MEFQKAQKSPILITSWITKEKMSLVTKTVSVFAKKKRPNSNWERNAFTNRRIMVPGIASKKANSHSSWLQTGWFLKIKSPEKAIKFSGRWPNFYLPDLQSNVGVTTKSMNWDLFILIGSLSTLWAKWTRPKRIKFRWVSQE